MTTTPKPWDVTYASRDTIEELAVLSDEQLEARLAELGQRRSELTGESRFGVVYELRALRGRVRRVQWETGRRDTK